MEDQNTEQNTDKQLALGGFYCDKCNRSFDKKAGLLMHDSRVHTKKLGTGYRWKTRLTQAERLQRRREYGRKWRLAKGMTPRVQSWIESNPKIKKAVKEKAQKRPRIQYVYPHPEEPLVPVPDNIAALMTSKVSKLKCCPNCGEELWKWRKQ